MINALIQTALEHNVPFSLLVGRLEPGGNPTKDKQRWQLMTATTTWRPMEKSDYVLGRIVPSAPLPTFDAEEVLTGEGKRAFRQMQHHRLCLRVPQPTSDPNAYEIFRQVAVEALDVFDHLSSQERQLRILTSPSSYMATGGGLVQNNVMTTQHFPLVIEDASGHEVLWVHPEAASIMAGGRLGGGQVVPAPRSAAVEDFTPSVAAVATGARHQQRTPPPAPPSAPPAASAEPPAIPATGSGLAWFKALQKEIQDLGIPEERAEAAMVKLRARDLVASHLAPTEVQALDQAKEEISRALFVVSLVEEVQPAPPAWYVALLEEAKTFGVPEASQMEYCLTMRAKQLQSKQTELSLPDAKALAGQEIQAILHPATTKPAVIRKPRTNRTPADSPAGPVALPLEVDAINVLVKEKRLTIAKVAELLSRDVSAASRYLSGRRGKAGLDVEVKDQLRKIAEAVTTGQPFPEPLAPLPPRKKGTGSAEKRAPGTPTAALPAEEV